MLIQADIPDDLVPWIAKAFADTFPAITAGLAPSPAIKAVIVSWVRQTLITYETERARSSGEVAVVAANAALSAAVVKAQRETAALTERLSVVVQDDVPAEDPATP